MPRYRKRGRGRALAAVPDDVRASIVAWVEWDDWDTICAVRAASSAFRNAVDGHIRCVLTRDAILPITSPVPAFFVDIAADLVTRPVCLGSRQTLRALFAKFYRVGHLEAVRACIDAPHSVDAVCFDQVLTLCDRFGTNRCLDVVQAWIRTTKRLRRDALSDALGSASMRCQWDLVRLLIEQGAVVNEYNNEALIWASWFGNWDVVRLLIDKGAVASSFSSKALVSASRKGCLEIVQLLLDHGAVASALQSRALVCASQGGFTAIVDLLLKHGAHATDQNNEALIMACENGHYDAVDLLLRNGADATTMDNYPVRLAQIGRHDRIVGLLVRYGAVVPGDNAAVVSSSGMLMQSAFP
ncbi:Ankyrin repeat domain-containing protein [Plasmodiophora brassicae]|uniref:Uncharacterized protein n=1 Tax=Plasmodiophora brassicae TaxID=37360 RepID=A0A0G4IUC7_PLABS|nr:hypothetical protein PBRA_006989 [Plasmodiophora brassicae]SPQ92945.1 unnamed protein product [Plasmodiophora brassicae]